MLFEYQTEIFASVHSLTINAWRILTNIGVIIFDSKHSETNARRNIQGENKLFTGILHWSDPIYLSHIQLLVGPLNELFSQNIRGLVGTFDPPNETMEYKCWFYYCAKNHPNHLFQCICLIICNNDTFMNYVSIKF